MATLTQSLGSFFGWVELTARGLDGVRRAAEQALERGRPLEAREHARELVERAPDVVVGFALWADAAEALWLDEEAVEALSAVCERAPFQARAWLRLGLVGMRTGFERARDALERAARSGDSSVEREARLALCDHDLGAGDPLRAARWLEPLRPLAHDASPAAHAARLRRVECALALGDAAMDEAETARLASAPLDPSGRTDAALSQCAAFAGRLDEATTRVCRALVLEAPTAGRAVLALVPRLGKGAALARVREAAEAMAWPLPRAWAAAFALAEGRVSEARLALAEAAREGDTQARGALCALAAAHRDREALALVETRAPGGLPLCLAAIQRALVALDRGDDDAALELLDSVVPSGAHTSALDADACVWADALLRQVFDAWLAVGAVPRVLGELARHARLLDRLEVHAEALALRTQLERPLRVAIVGEFNAGKSTFVNALLGADVAPTGILPTTATLHWLAWAPDRFARVVLRGAPDRNVPPERLKETLRALPAGEVERVFLYAPIERLRHAEILDTPGFNAPDPDHARRARWAFEEAHVVLWLLDATGPLKESERQVLSELAARKLPIAVLVNKRDRLKESELAAVLSHVEAGLRGAGLALLGRPLALSARRALEALAKGASPAPDTGWPEVEAFLEAEVVGRSDALRTGAIVSRALSLAGALLALYSERQARADERARAAATESARRLGGAIALREASAALALRAERELGEGLRLLEHDLRPLGQLDPARLASCRAYVEERTAARLLPPLLAALERAAGVALPEAGAAVARGVLLGALAGTDPSSLRARAGAVAERAALASADELERASRQAPLVYPEQRSQARLRALAAALAAAEQATLVAGAGRERE